MYSRVLVNPGTILMSDSMIECHTTMNVLTYCKVMLAINVIIDLNECANDFYTLTVILLYIHVFQFLH